MGTASFAYNGTYQTWTVPQNVYACYIAARGGGSTTSDAGYVYGRRAVTPGQVLYVFVGGQGGYNSGTTGGNGAYPGGGAGGNGTSGANGGHGGGGYSAVRLGSTAGTVICAAAGSGGISGDQGDGGDGGASTGASGSPGTAGTGSTGAATGGTQTQGGFAGNSSSGSGLSGANAASTTLGAAGHGGNGAAAGGHGGGGGGGGWRGGGGGCGAATGYAPGGGGAGGSNYTGGLTSVTSTRAGGTSGGGAITITWSDPTPGLQSPATPTSLLPTAGTATKAMYSQAISGIVTDPDGGQVRLMIRISRDPTFATYAEYITLYVASGQRASNYIPVSANGFYHVRCWAQDETYRYSLTYATTNFWSNRSPNPPTLNAPADNIQSSPLSALVFSWSHSDPDPSSPQNGAELRYRTVTTGLIGPWVTISKTGTTATHTVAASTFKSNTFYEWTVRTSDGLLWGPWAVTRRFYATGTSSAPRPLDPINGEANDVTQPIVLSWMFNDPNPGDHQVKADIRYRVKGTSDAFWVTVTGDVTTPGATHSWTLAANTLTQGVQWEWQVRTYDYLSGGTTPSDWSASAFFWGVYAPGILAINPVLPAQTVPMGNLGCGTYRVFIYDRGGTLRLGELTPLTTLEWSRKRDDISNCVLVTNGFGSDCCELLANTRSFRHELVVYRDGVRVWEGPISRIEYRNDSVEIEARDVMNYVYRRILRQGYNDTYPRTVSVVYRAARIIINAMAPDDPNVTGYLTQITFSNDAKESRVREPYSVTAWEEVDDLAATAGLDYTVVGRRIVLWDTHRPLGRLPEMRDGDFSNPLIVSEYGMSLAGEYAVTNGSGIYGVAVNTSAFAYYGLVELLSSAYGDTAGATDAALTQAAKDTLVRSLTEQATRGIAARYPAPVIVRVPDNSTLSPNTPVDINQLVPGVWIPLQAEATCRKVSQWQKLDSITVHAEAGAEQVQVVMSPAPRGGIDPDANPIDTAI